MQIFVSKRDAILTLFHFKELFFSVYDVECGRSWNTSHSLRTFQRKYLWNEPYTIVDAISPTT
jgi:hypothetical protein